MASSNVLAEWDGPHSCSPTKNGRIECKYVKLLHTDLPSSKYSKLRGDYKLGKKTMWSGKRASNLDPVENFTLITFEKHWE